MKSAIVICAFMVLCHTKSGAAQGTACTKEYDPICGSDRTTYSNGCQLGSANCQKSCDQQVTVVQRGRCGQKQSNLPPSSDKCEHNNYCTSEYSPRCGSDGVTYSNQCLLDKANCRRCDKCRIAVQRPCACNENPCKGGPYRP